AGDRKILVQPARHQLSFSLLFSALILGSFLLDPSLLTSALSLAMFSSTSCGVCDARPTRNDVSGAAGRERLCATSRVRSSKSRICRVTPSGTRTREVEGSTNPWREGGR